ncbi:hypothetical protein FHX40_3099 [Thermopolyspora flexuosa]|uniref:Uncharacterized protein n=2 Tax=Thermopolyspora flexuosa TaxID=103836 RepID=A0A543J0K9_9ACTN|nr:hypothetical protein FHX40_3099 [Thermopolyspora flexuosa]
MERPPPVPPGTGPLSPDFSGMNPALMAEFVALLEKAQAVLREETGAILAELARVGGDRTRMLRVQDVANWVERQLPDLRRREELARKTGALPSWTPGGGQGLRPFDESAFVSVTEARLRGAALARSIGDVSPFTIGARDRYATFVKTLAEHEDDPDFTAAFFAELGLESTLDLGRRLRGALGDDADKAIDTVSRAFGTAIRSGGGSRAFAQMRERLAAGPVLTKAGGVTVRKHGLGDLLRAGEFPAGWLAGVVNRHALAPDSNVSGEDLAGFLNALGNNPAAARAAIAAATRDVPLETFLRRLNDRVAVRSSFAHQDHLQAKENSRADAFGRMLAAAAGAYDERDGAHSAEAARLAFDLIRTLPKLDIAEPTRVHLAEIAGAYATEITEGANLSDANRTLPSAFGAVKTVVPGLKPAFRLSPADTFAFVKTFATSPATIKPFEKGMGDLADRLVRAAADGARGIEPLERVMRALGHVSGMQYAAERLVQGALDAEDEARRKGQSFLLGLALGVAGIVVPLEGQALWLALSTGAPLAFDKLTEVDKTRLQALDDKVRLAALARGHWLVNALIDSGFRPTVPATDPRFAHPPITGPDGRLLPFDQIAKDKQALRNLNNWLIANGSGGTSKTKLGEAAKWLDEIVFNGARATSAQDPAPH